MQIIRFPSCKSKEHFAAVLEKIYKLQRSEYVLSSSEDGVLQAEIRTDENLDGSFKIVLEDDDFYARLSVYPSINEGQMITYSDVSEELGEQNIVNNVDEERIKECLSFVYHGNILENVVIAKGIKPIDGRNAEIIKHFKEPESQPAVDHKGKVDFREVSKIINVNKDDLLITKKPATKGVPGVTVRNAEIPPKEGKDIDLKILEGVYSDNNGRKFYASIDGHVVFRNNNLGVFPVYTVNNVDYNTGNIRFNGTVEIRGDVFSGFTVEAERDIFVNGICEDATLKAKGQIVISGGIKGKANNMFSCNKDFICGYMENAKVESMGSIIIKKYAFNCNLLSGSKLVATESKGLIAGGYVQAFSEIEVKQLGSEGATNFTVHVGENYLIEKEYDEVEKELKKKEELLDKIDKTLSQINLKSKEVLKNPKVIAILNQKKEQDKIKESLREHLETLKKKLKFSKPKIRVHNYVTDGVTIQFYNTKFKIRERMKNMIFFWEPKYEQIAWISMKDPEAANYE
jgi:hypothetical protein